MNKIIWALYDDGFGSWNKLESTGGYTIISIGINENKDWKNYYKIDLRMSNFDLIKQLKKLPKPDIIVASPPCEGWSIADNIKRHIREINYNDFIVYNKTDYSNLNLKYVKSTPSNYFYRWRTSLISIETAITTAYIISYFNPKTWIIENPQTSKIWDFYVKQVSLFGYKNLAYYSLYDNTFTKKPTIFFSNMKLNLKNSGYKKYVEKIGWKRNLSYDLKAKIPADLLKHILEEIKNYEQ